VTLYPIMDQFIDIDLLLNDEAWLRFHYLVCTVQNHLLILFFADLFHRILSEPALDNNLVEFQLYRLSADDLLLNWVLYD
jgi:hypothetical protein